MGGKGGEGMKVYVNWHEFEIDVEKIKRIGFYYDSKKHRWSVHLNGWSEEETFEISEKKGEAIIEFLKWLSKESKKLSTRDLIVKKTSTPGSEDSFDMVLTKKSSIVGPGDEENFDVDHDEDFFDFQGEVIA